MPVSVFFAAVTDYHEPSNCGPHKCNILVLQVRGLAWDKQVSSVFLSGGAGRECVSLHFPPSRGWLYSLPRGPFHPQSRQWLINSPVLSNTGPSSPLFLFFFKDFIYLFEREREREREKGGDRQREKQAPRREPDVGLNPGAPGSRPELKADTQH